MTDENIFREITIVLVLLIAFIGIYHRASAARSGEKISRREEGKLIWLRLFGLLLWLGLLLSSWFIFLTTTPLIVYLVIRTPIEEANLIQRFGDQYCLYMQSTGRFFPRLRR